MLRRRRLWTFVSETSEILYVIDYLAVLIVFKFLVLLDGRTGAVLLFHLMQNQSDNVILLLLKLGQLPLNLSLRALQAQGLEGRGKELSFRRWVVRIMMMHNGLLLMHLSFMLDINM